MKTGLFSLPEPMGWKAAIDYAAELGVDAIEPAPFGMPEFAGPNVDEAKRLADYAAEKGVGVCCFSMLGNFFTDDIPAEIQRLKNYADVAAAMGSPYLHHTLIPSLNAAEVSLPFQTLLDRVVPAVREICDYAQQKGVKCAYEDQGFVFNGVQRFDDLLGELNRDVGVVADLGNIYFVDERPESFISRFASRVCHVHAKDYLFKPASGLNPGEGWYTTRGGNYLRGTILGHGVVNLHRVIGILQSAGYDGCWSMECDALEEPRMANALGLVNLLRMEKIAQAERS